MAENQNKIRSALPYVLICACTFGVMLLLNQRTVYTADDYMYHFFWEGAKPGPSTRLLSGIFDLPGSLWNHYLGFNGRVVSHALVMFFMLFDKMVFNVCNSLMYLATGWLLFLYMEPDPGKRKPWQLGVIYLAMWTFFPHFGWSVLWVSGSCNYLWMNALLLIFFLPYQRRMDAGKSEKHRIIQAVLIVPLGLLAGASSENGGGAVGLLALLFVIHWFLKKERIPAFAYLGILSAAVGMGFLLLAPSSHSRVVSEPFQIAVYLKRIREVVGFSYHYILPLLVVLLTEVFFWVRYKKSRGEPWLPCLAVPFYYCLSGAASVIVLLASPIISGKSWIFAVSFLLIAIGRIALMMEAEGCDIRKGKRFFLGLLVLLAAAKFILAWTDISRTCAEVQVQIQRIEEQKNQGILDVEVPLLTSTENTYNVIRHSPNVSKDPEDWFNQWMALYYGVDSITGVEP